MASQNRISLGDIAREAGVSRMTVSYALRNSARIPDATRSRIQSIAKQLGYMPDARIATIMSGVRASKTGELQSIGWINTALYADSWQRFKWLSPYIEGAKERCHELGYKLDEIWLRSPGMTSKRISDIFHSRGIKGVVITPSTISLTHLKLNWSNFACISFEKALLAPRLHRTAPDYYYNILLSMKMLRRFGYRRIGLILQQLTERSSHHGYLAGLQYFQSGIPENERVTPLVYRHVLQVRGATPLFRSWVDENRLDAVIGQHSELTQWLEAAGRPVPTSIGVAHLGLDDDCADWAGVWQRKREIGAQTIEQVVSMINNNRFGLPATPFDTLIPGTWRAGKTLITPKPPRLAAEIQSERS